MVTLGTSSGTKAEHDWWSVEELATYFHYNRASVRGILGRMKREHYLEVRHIDRCVFVRMKDVKWYFARTTPTVYTRYIQVVAWFKEHRTEIERMTISEVRAALDAAGLASTKGIIDRAKADTNIRPLWDKLSVAKRWLLANPYALWDMAPIDAHRLYLSDPENIRLSHTVMYEAWIALRQEVVEHA